MVIGCANFLYGALSISSSDFILICIKLIWHITILNPLLTEVHLIVILDLTVVDLEKTIKRW